MREAKVLRETENCPVIRTDFDNQDAWDTICKLIRMPVHDERQDFFAYVEFIDDPDFRDLTVEELIECIPDQYCHTFVFVVDKAATQAPELPILVVDLGDEIGRTFRAIPSKIQVIENNLSISNMAFAEFDDDVDEDGVFRGGRDDAVVWRSTADFSFKNSRSRFASENLELRVGGGFLGHAALEAGLKAALLTWDPSVKESGQIRPPNITVRLSETKYATMHNLVELATELARIRTDLELGVDLGLPSLALLMRSRLTLVDGLELFDQFSSKPSYNTGLTQFEGVGREYSIALEALFLKLSPVFAEER
jgi:hypothetical protein